ncbi:MAG TPA: hypothetical protein VK814_13805 [Acidobacteriaceae bacterium]|jgi:hypothetical protein|nr:hypothetical protein [Acidobacteriaceae bacterium]
MRKIFLSAILFLAATYSFAQATNPQNTFANAVNSDSPSLWLNFNEGTSAFQDSVSGASFGPAGGPVVEGTVPASLSAGAAEQIAVNGYAPLPTGSLTSFTVKFASAPPAGPLTIVILNNGGSNSFTIANSFSVSVAAATLTQIFTAPTNFTAVTVTSGQLIGYWVGAGGTEPGYGTLAGGSACSISGYASLPGGANTYTCASGYGYGITASVIQASAGTTAIRQSGFDNTNNSNYSAGFTYNAWNAAPNVTLGSTMEWNTPWTMLLHINKLNWDHGPKLILASKGDLNAAAINNNNWQLFIQQNGGNAAASQLCFSRNGPAPYTQLGGGASFLAHQQWCSPTITDATPNTFNYDIVVEDNGTGSPTAISMWINGSAQSLLSAVSTNGFGGVTIAITNGGSGFTSAPTIGSTGGGTNCTIAGTTATVTSGVVTSVVAHSSGCIYAPAITVTGGAGSGAVFTATAYPMTMNSPSYPLVVPGYVYAGVYYGPGGTDTSENPLYVDEFAEFPGNLSFGQITNIFYETKFWQNLVYPGLTANPPLVIFGNYQCGPDFSADQTTAMVIAAHQAGLIRLIGIDDDDPSANGYNSAPWFRQMLDQAGLADVPVSVGTNQYGPNLGGCPAANITAYNANTPQNPASYESATTMYRTLFAKYSTRPIDVLMTQTATGYNNFQLSSADSISPLTGLQLQAQNYANGGWVNAFEGNFATSPTAYLSLLNNTGNYPIYFEGGSPNPGGPGIYVSRTALDPLRQAAVGTTQDTVQGWTNQNLAQVISPYFQGGETITLSGGTGYASATAFTSVGGGPSCNTTGYMLSTSGVPSSVVTPWYAPVPSSYGGTGYGCTPAVFTATGNGANLTVSAVTLGTITIGDTISGTGIPTGTKIVSQTSGMTGGAGVYVTSVATTASASTVTRTPTIVLTSPTGTGVTMTVSNGIFIKSYEGTATASYAVYPNMWSTQPLFTWFQNSLMDAPTTGTPRPY